MDGKDIRKRFGANLKHLRNRSGLSQLDLSGKAGLAHNFINDLENGKKWFSPETMAKLSNALEVDPSQLLIPRDHTDNEEAILRNAYMEDVNQSLMHAMENVLNRYRKG
jgi:transcriptional regulator with XRE-family HTH domain